MSDWNSAILTKKGLNLQAKVEAGETLLNVTKIQLGSGILDANEDSSNLIALKKSEKDIEISDKIPQDGGLCTISGVISNQDINIGFYVKEMGLFATDPDEGEILYMYTTDNKPDYLPAKSTNKVVNASYNIDVAISNSELITAKINQVGLVTVEIMQHNITEHDSSEVAHKSVFKSLFNITDMTLDSMKSIIQNWSKKVCLPLYGGELTGDITANNVYANNNVLVFNNVAEMKASNKVKAGYTLKTLGFYQSGDGGGADYVIVDDIGDDEVDDGSIIALQKGLYAKLLVKNSIVDIKVFGAKGDSVTDNTEAINKANNFANKNGYTLFISNGIFGVTSVTLNCKNVIGSYNSNLSKILCLEEVDLMIDRKNCDIANIENITIDCNNKAKVCIDTSYTLQNGPSVNANHRNIRIVNPVEKGWVAQNNNDVWWEGVQIAGSNSIALEAIGTGGPITIKDCNFLNGETVLSGQYINLTNNVISGLRLASNGWNVLSCIGNYLFPNKDKINIILDGPCFGMSFIGTHIENRDGGSIIGGTAKLNTRKISFEGCHIFSTSGTANMLSEDIGQPYYPSLIEIQGGTINIDDNINLNERLYFSYSLKYCNTSNDELVEKTQKLSLTDIELNNDFFFLRRITEGVKITIQKNNTTNIDLENFTDISKGAIGFILIHTSYDAPRCIVAYAKTGSYNIAIQNIVSTTGIESYKGATITVSGKGNSISITSTANKDMEARIVFVGFAGGY